MMLAAWKVNYRFGATVFLFVSTLWVPMSVYAGAWNGRRPDASSYPCGARINS